MLRLIPVLILCSSAIAMAEEPAAQPAPPVAQAAPVEAAERREAVEATETAEAVEAVEAPKMKKVCRSVDVVGSAIPRQVCTMKPVRKPRDQ